MSVFKRSRRWWYDFTINGIRYRKPIPQAKTKREAQEQEAADRAAVYEGTFTRTKPTTFTQFVEEVYKPYAEANYRSTTYKSILNILTRHFGDYQLSDFSPLLIEKYKHKRLKDKTVRDKPLKPATVYNELAVLSKILSLAVSANLIKENPCRKVTRIRLNNQRNRVISYEEEQQIMQVLKPNKRNIFIVAMHTGMRRGEISGLTWQQIDEQNGSIYLPDTKSGRPRVVPINNEVKKVFATLDRQSERLFPCAKQEISRSIKKAVEKLQLPDAHFHDIRHTFATRLGAAGVDAFTIAEILGHSNLKMTMRYTHTDLQRKLAAVENLGHKSVTSVVEWKARKN